MSDEHKIENALQSILGRAAAAAISGPGKAYAAAALNPPHAGAVGIPDNFARPSAKTNVVVTRPVGAPSGTPVDGTWDLLICSHPGDALHAFALAAPAGTDFNTIDAAPQYLLGDAPGPAWSGVGDCQVRGVGEHPDGIQTTVDFSAKYAKPISGASSFRTVGQSITVTFAGSSFHNGGVVTSAVIKQTPTKRVLAQVKDESGNAAICWSEARQLSFSEDDLVNSKYYNVRRIADGTFMINSQYPGDYLTAPTAFNSDYSTLDAVVEGLTKVPAGARCTVRDDPLPGTQLRLMNKGTGIPLSRHLPAYDLGLDSADIRFAIFRGISATATVTIKSVKKIEYTDYGSGEYVKFLTEIEPDPAAITMVTMLAQQLAPSYPASYNFLGAIPGILRAVGPHILKALPVAIDVFRQLTDKTPSEPKLQRTATRPRVIQRKAKSADKKRRRKRK